MAVTPRTSGQIARRQRTSDICYAINPVCAYSMTQASNQRCAAEGGQASSVAARGQRSRHDFVAPRMSSVTCGGENRKKHVHKKGRGGSEKGLGRPRRLSGCVSWGISSFCTTRTSELIAFRMAVCPGCGGGQRSMPDVTRFRDVGT